MDFIRYSIRMALIERVRTGVEGLNQMLHGGLLPKRPYIVCGPRGMYR